MNDMNIACFIALSTSKSLVSTMSMLNLSKGAVLQNIRHLENDLGLVLFYTTTPTVRLTDAGEAFYDYFKAFEEHLIRGAESLIVQDGTDKNHELHIAVSEYTDCPPWILEGLKHYCGVHPEIAPVITQEAPEVCSRLLEEGKADLLITSLQNIPDPERYARLVPLEELPLFLWVREDAEPGKLPLLVCAAQEQLLQSERVLLEKNLSLLPREESCANTDTRILKLCMGSGMMVSPETGRLRACPGLTAIPIGGTVTLCLVSSVYAETRDADALFDALTQQRGEAHEL